MNKNRIQTLSESISPFTNRIFYTKLIGFLNYLQKVQIFLGKHQCYFILRKYIS